MALSNRVLALPMALVAIGCTAPGTKYVEAIRSTSEVHLVLRDTAGPFMTGMKTTDKRNPNHTPDMIKDQHAEVGAKAKRLNEVFVAGTRDQWPQALASLGISVSPRRRDIDGLRITVLARHLDCNAWACAVYYQMKTEVLDPKGTSIWHVVSRYGQGDYDTPIDERLFKEYATEVTGFMLRAKLVGGVAK